jgi:FkbM family methyltransferase
VVWRRIDRSLGLLRSLIVYWRPGRQRGLRGLYRPFISPGDVVFDVGAHLGDRTAAFSHLGARVVALEPQPRIRRWLERLVGRDPRVTIRAEAVGSAQGRAVLSISRRNPTVSTLADEWHDELPRRNAGFEHVHWEESVEVPVTTLDALIEQYGLPSFCKIDVEGFEAEALRGLSRPIPALSVEFVQGALEVAVACVRRLDTLGPYEFNAVPGEQRTFISADWMTPDRMVKWLEDGAGGVPSGDVYARARGRLGGAAER